MSDPIVITGIARTPMGSMQGKLAAESVTDLGASAISSAISRSGIANGDVDEVLMGCVLSAGVGQAPARQAALKANLPINCTAATINKVCGSGMKAVTAGRLALLGEDRKIVVAGGMESMSRAPHLLPGAREGYRLGHAEIKDHMFLDGLQDASSSKLMGNFAEKTAEKFTISRDEQDDFAIDSLERANRAANSGAFDNEIVPYKIKTRAGVVTMRYDEGPEKARPAKIPQLRPAFAKDGTVTAANASGIADGAAAVVMMRESEAQHRGLRPLARIVSASEYGCEPEWFTTAPVGAIVKCLSRARWNIQDIDLFEINEAFAVVTLATMMELQIPHDKVNVHGGACALGHPIGASGARILVTLISALKTRGLKRGVASLCIGGGEGIAVAVEVF